MNHSSRALAISVAAPSGWSRGWAFHRVFTREGRFRHIRCLGPSVVRRSQTVSAGTNRVHRDRRRVLSGWTVDRVHDQRKRPAQRLRSTVSRGRREISSIKGRRKPACLASGWQGIVLPRSGRDPDGGADRRHRVNSMPECRRPSSRQARRDVIYTRQGYAVTKDGKRFLVNARPQQSSAAPLTVVVNWTAAIQK